MQCETRHHAHRWVAAMFVGVLLSALLATEATASPVSDAQVGARAVGQRQCQLPSRGQQPERATPAEVGLDPNAVTRAMRFAETHNRLSVRIFRNNCLVATSVLDPLVANVPWNIWSSTKSVVSMLAGIAYTQGKLDLTAPIGRYLPPGMGDAAHRAITVEDLLTESSGMKTADVTELATGGLDVSAPAQALALPIEHAPGTYFEYSQRGIDLLAFVVQRAVGTDLQAFAQHDLFGPIGIAPNSHLWLRDRSGNTYGWADLFLPPADFARLGLLLVNNGVWNGRRVISPAYLGRATSPSGPNRCYGYTFWLNHSPCVAPSLPSRQTFDVTPFAPMPADTYATVGFGQQNNFVVPSLHLLVEWTGEYGDMSLDPQTLLASSPASELYHDFFRRLGPGITDAHLADPGPYVPRYNLDIDPLEMIDPLMPLGALALGPYAPPGCNVLRCQPGAG